MIPVRKQKKATFSYNFTKSVIFKKNNRPPKAVFMSGPFKGPAQNKTIGETTQKAALQNHCSGYRCSRTLYYC